MTEALKKVRENSKKIFATSLVSAIALSGCAGDEKETKWTVGVECPEGKDVKIAETTNPSSKIVSSAVISLSCDGEAPISIQQLAGEGTNVSGNSAAQHVEISANFQDGDSFDYADQDPALSFSIDEAGATINLKGVRRINQVEVVPATAE